MSHVYGEESCSNTKRNRSVLFPFFFRLYNFLCDVPGERVYEAYKRKIEEGRRKRVVNGTSRIGGYVSEGKQRTTVWRYITWIDILRFFIIKYIEGAKFLFWSVKSWCLRSKHTVPSRRTVFLDYFWLCDDWSEEDFDVGLARWK